MKGYQQMFYQCKKKSFNELKLNIEKETFEWIPKKATSFSKLKKKTKTKLDLFCKLFSLFCIIQQTGIYPILPLAKLFQGVISLGFSYFQYVLSFLKQYCTNCRPIKVYISILSTGTPWRFVSCLQQFQIVIPPCHLSVWFQFCPTLGALQTSTCRISKSLPLKLQTLSKKLLAILAQSARKGKRPRLGNRV